MHNKFTTIIDRDEQWFIARCPEIPGANGQGMTQDEALRSLASAIQLILEDRRVDALRGLPVNVVRRPSTEDDQRMQRREIMLQELQNLDELAREVSTQWTSPKAALEIMDEMRDESW